MSGMLMVTDDPTTGKASLSWNDFRLATEAYTLDFSKDNFATIYATYSAYDWVQRQVSYTPDNVTRYARIRTESQATNIVSFAHAAPPPPPPPPEPAPVGPTKTGQIDIYSDGSIKMVGLTVAEEMVLVIE